MGRGRMYQDPLVNHFFSVYTSLIVYDNCVSNELKKTGRVIGVATGDLGSVDC